MRAKLKAAVGSLLVGGVLAGAAVMPASGQAAQIGDLCWIHTSYPTATVYSDEYLVSGIYSLAGGQAFRVLGFAGADLTVPSYYGRGNGMPTGYLPRFYINQATCTQ